MPPSNIYGRFHLQLPQLDPEVFSKLDVFRTKMSRAEDRCRQIGRSERLLDYEDSWRAYSDMADELKQLYRWVYEELI